MADYEKYQVEGFVMDESFQKWVLQTEEQDQLFWQEWIAKHPKQKDAIEEAREIILLLGYEEKEIKPERIARTREIIQKRVHSKNQTSLKKRTNRSLSYGVAAASVVLGLLSWIIYSQINSDQNLEQVFETNYGQTRPVSLPDGSEIILNANSKLSFQAFNPTQREVWLEGEAFFQIKTILSAEDSTRKQKFVVHTPELDIEVLGTGFNVYTREEQTQVVLHHGSVRLHLNHPDRSEVLTMQPGEMVIFQPSGNLLTKQPIDTSISNTWRENKLVFDEVSLQEVAKLLRENYGLTLIITDSTLAQKKFVGSVPANNIEVLFTALEKLYGLQITRKGNQVYLNQIKQAPAD